jgi:hypothetical protein
VVSVSALGIGLSPASTRRFTGKDEVRVVATASGWMIEGETTGDGKADFSILVLDPTHAITWGSNDFVLVA